MNNKILIVLYSLILSACVSIQQGHLVRYLDFMVDDGSVISLPIAAGGPLPAEKEGYKVMGAGTMTEIKKGNPEQSELKWHFSFVTQLAPKIERVMVEMVSPSGELTSVVNDQAPVLINSGTWVGQSKPSAMSQKALPWLYMSGDSTFLFKFTIFEAGKAPVVLYQPSITTQGVKKIYINLIKG